MKSDFVFVIALSVTYVENECGRGEKKREKREGQEENQGAQLAGSYSSTSRT